MKFHYILLINQVSGNGNGKKTGAIIQNLLDEQKMSYESYYTEYAGHEAELAKELANSKLIGWNAEIKADYADKLYPLLVVIGGDGTLHQVLNQFYRMDKEIPVSYIPGGSGNDFARGINLPKDPQKAFWAIQRAKEPQIINTLTYEEKIQTETGLAINNIGIGLDAAIVAATNDSMTKKTLNKYNLGSFAYIASIVKVLFTQKGFPILLEVNGEEFTFKKAFLCTTTNHPYFGGGVAIAPMAKATVSDIDLVVVERISMIKIFGLIIRLITNKLTTSKHYHHFTGHKLRIVSTVPEYGQADGEVMGLRPFDITFSTRPQLIWYYPE
ncbi:MULTISPECIES: diacylglycerol kinase family protein [Enterococcus]|uniref:diacylglycerol/lipid kinase family protein n=1 Tax=Enterococcus TaxID=1350 RepID=UPI00249E2E2C|nr:MULTISPECIES: diacylglycerol kinase family protein [Enterococcus]MDT2739391.1 diacylglycerol kinase family protein [Enterococcus canintestini]WHA09833.1 diacylglycerol kinase family protein [Enterococcus montenegrensis]